MLGADLIGFQTHSYARHFRQTVSRILSVEATPKGIQLFSGLSEGRLQGTLAQEMAHPGIAVKVSPKIYQRSYFFLLPIGSRRRSPWPCEDSLGESRG